MEQSFVEFLHVGVFLLGRQQPLSEFIEDLLHAAGLPRGEPQVHHQLGEIARIVEAAQDGVHLAHDEFEHIDLVVQHAQQVFLDCARLAEIEDEHVVFLADAMDAADALLQPHGVPRQVEVDHSVGELEVAALAARAGGKEHVGFVAAAGDGGILVATGKIFEGVVRNQTRGRKTVYLDYEAYEEMALEQMEALAIQAVQQFQIRDVAIVHRLGRIEIGETSVLIAVASAHRAAAFDACRWLIDTLKRTVPIWKKEYFGDGAVWADGEPFPPEIPRANS